MLRFVITLCAVAFLGMGCAPSLTGPQATRLDVADAREIIVLAKPPAGSVIRDIEQLGYVLKSSEPLRAVNDTLLVFTIPEGRTIADAIAEIEAASPGVTAGANHLYRTQATGEAEGRFYANALINWRAQGCTALQPVGLIDAGVPDSYLRAAQGRLRQRSFVGGLSPAQHGTNMADLLIGPGRLSAGRVFSANVVDPGTPGGDGASVTAILRAMEWLSSERVGLVNISLAGPRNKLLDRAMGQAAENGMVFVAAAGNAGPDAPAQFPAAFPFVMAVTAIDRDTKIYRNAVRGAQIDLAAPGVDILLGGPESLRVISGTSAAAPFVTGAIAADPELQGLRVDQIRQRLTARARDLGRPGRDRIFGAGLVSAPDRCRGP